LAWDHLSVIGAITPAGQVFHQVYEHATSRVEGVRFLRHLLRHLDGKQELVGAVALFMNYLLMQRMGLSVERDRSYSNVRVFNRSDELLGDVG
jgi:putative transposase